MCCCFFNRKRGGDRCNVSNHAEGRERATAIVNVTDCPLKNGVKVTLNLRVYTSTYSLDPREKEPRLLSFGQVRFEGGLLFLDAS